MVANIARGRRSGPTSGISSQSQFRVRSHVIPVHDESREGVRRPSGSLRSHRTHSSRSDSEHSPSFLRRSGSKRSRRVRRSPSHDTEPPAWAKDFLKALEEKIKEIKVVEEQLASLKRKSSKEEPELK